MSRMTFGTRTFALIALCLAVGACTKTPQPPGLAIVNAWVRLSPVAARPAAAYFTVTNGGSATTLTAVDSPRVKRIELHDNQMSGMNGAMHMMPLAQVPIPAGGRVEFQPGGMHAMLFDVDPQVRAGSVIPLTFRLAGGRSVDAQAHVVAAGDPPPDSH